MHRKKDAAVFILMGQSNAVGYGTLMEEKDKLIVPLRNVYGLSREYNLSYENQELTWTGYTSHGTILGEENDHTCSVTNCLAYLWQAEVDEGRELPDLYMINIAIGAQGVTPGYMWDPKREPKLIPGPLGTVDISLYPFAVHILSLLSDSFQKLGKSYEIMGIHWRGGENDITVSADELSQSLKKIYKEIFFGFYRNLGEIPPVILHRIVCPERAMNMDLSGEYLKSMDCINQVFEDLAKAEQNISIFDARNAPFYVSDTKEHGIFMEDLVHYTPEANWWVANCILDHYKSLQIGRGERENEIFSCL